MPLTSGPSFAEQNKWYFHNAANGLSGTFPTTKQSVRIPTDAVTAVASVKSASGKIGTSQASITKASVAQTTQQLIFFTSIFVVQTPLAAQTITNRLFGSILSGGIQQSNSNAVFNLGSCCYVWRPSGGGSLVGTLWDNPNLSLTSIAASGTSETWQNGANHNQTVSITTQAGDVLIFEFWSISTQTMSTSYTLTFYFDGTTEGSATSAASFITSGGGGLIFNDVAPGPIKFMDQAINRSASYCLGKLWVPKKPRIWIPQLEPVYA